MSHGHCLRGYIAQTTFFKPGYSERASLVYLHFAYLHLHFMSHGHCLRGYIAQTTFFKPGYSERASLVYLHFA